MDKNLIGIFFIGLLVLSGCTRMEKVRAFEGSADRAYEELGTLEVFQPAHRMTAGIIVGSGTEVLVEGPSRRGGQLAGRDPYHRVVNLNQAAFPSVEPIS